MRNLILTIFFWGLVFISQAQISNPAEEVASRIAQKMSDSLDLSVQQKKLIYDINIQLNIQKVEARQANAGNISTITKEIQRIENTRDALYSEILGSEKYKNYKKKKKYLVNNN